MTGNNLWFKRKKYGWGWTPATWQGWLLITLYVVLLAAYPIVQELQGLEFSEPVFFGIAIALTALLLFISYQTGEKPKWSWGDE